MQSSLPDDWMREVEEAITKPEVFKFATAYGIPNWHRPDSAPAVVVPEILREKYDLFHTRALAHSKTRGEHEIAATLNFYIIYKYRLWAAECTSWDEYTDYIGNSAFGVAKSTVEHDVLKVKELLDSGMALQSLISGWAVAKGATKRLAGLSQDQLPDGDINKAAELLSQGSSREAHQAVNDWLGIPQIHSTTATHDSALNRLYFEIKIVLPDGDWKRKDYMIADIQKEEADWVMDQLRVKGAYRTYK